MRQVFRVVVGVLALYGAAEVIDFVSPRDEVVRLHRGAVRCVTYGGMSCGEFSADVRATLQRCIAQNERREPEAMACPVARALVQEIAARVQR